MIWDTSMYIRWFWEKRQQAHVKPTWCEEDDGHGDEGADHQDDQQSNGNPLPVPLRRTHPAQVLQRGKRERKTWMSQSGKEEDYFAVFDGSTFMSRQSQEQRLQM